MTQLSTRHCANCSLYPKLKFVQEKVWACLMNLTWDLEPMIKSHWRDYKSELYWLELELVYFNHYFIYLKENEASLHLLNCSLSVWHLRSCSQYYSKRVELEKYQRCLRFVFFSPYSQILTILFCWIFISIFNNLAFQWTLETWFKRKVTLFMDIENGSSRPA